MSPVREPDARLPIVDLRSDTVTRPTRAMREAIARAEVGDDVLGDDPTTRLLEERVAEMLGKERALFFPSGTMANQTALAVLGCWGAEVLLEAGAHILHYEEGAAAALSGLQLRPVPTKDGILTGADLAAAVRVGRYVPRQRVLALENTHLSSGGRVMPLEAVREVVAVAREMGLSVHLDGARLWNACAASGHEPAEYGRCVDTVMVSLSKGLGAPVGSVLAGSEGVMEFAWRVRRRLGGGMRQSGLLAAAGLHALDHHRDRLQEDHRHARSLFEAFRAVPGARPVFPETNVLLVELASESVNASLLSFLEKHRILMSKFGLATLRAVTHLDVDSVGISRVREALERWDGQEEHAGHLA